AVAVLCAIAVAYLLIEPALRTNVEATYGIDPFAPLVAIAIGAGVVCALARVKRAFLAYAGVLASVLWVVSFWVNPLLNDIRSGQAFVNRVQQVSDPYGDLAIAAFKEQYLLYMSRPVVHFGHARWM